VLPFLAAQIAVLLAIALVPAITLTVPRLTGLIN
jgi:TRAP-type C4-dicarboxylate transport system permease large subunit